MNGQVKETQKINHKRNVLVIIAIVLTAVIGWKAFAAAQCINSGGDIQFSGISFYCLFDFRNR